MNPTANQGCSHKPVSIRVIMIAPHDMNSAIPEHNSTCSSPVFVWHYVQTSKLLTGTGSKSPTSLQEQAIGTKAVIVFFYPDCSSPMTQIMEN